MPACFTLTRKTDPEAGPVDSCRCGARWADDDFARCPGCGRDLDVEITISYDEERDAKGGPGSRRSLLLPNILRPGERAVRRTSTEAWSIVSPDGEESPCVPWTCMWLDHLDRAIREEAEKC